MDKQNLFPRLSWRPYPLLFLYVFFPKSNVKVAARIYFMMREFRRYRDWCKKSGPLELRASPEVIEEENELTFAIGSHARWVRKIKRTSGPNIIPRMALLKLERQTEKRYRSYGRGWTEDFQRRLSLVRQQEDEQLAQTVAYLKDIMKDTDKE
jgi:hypothetical protein